VKDGIAFLEGRERALVGDLRIRMDEAAEELRFEAAAALRDRIAAVERTIERQRIFSLTGRNRDVFGLYREGDLTQVSAHFIRNGRMIGQKAFPLIRLRAENGEILSSLLKQYYDGVVDIPDEIVIPEGLEDSDIVAEWLTEKRGKGVAVVTPKRGETLALLEIARRNAENAFRTTRLATDRPMETLPLLEEKLGLRNTPLRIECFDISNIGGKHAVGAMVTFAAGAPLKEGYRRFRIRTVPGADDYAMLYEVLNRRYEKRENLPDLIMVDGGKGQLGVALAVLKDLRVEGVDVIGMAKERDDHPRKMPVPLPDHLPYQRELQSGSEGPTVYQLSLPIDEKGSPLPPAGRRSRMDTAGKGEDRIYLPGRKDPVYLSRWPMALFLLQRIRDEAHRFAVSYHRKVKEKEDLQSLLDRIPGIGAKRRRALLTFFGDVKRIRSASVRDLRHVEGIGGEMADRILKFLDAEK